MTNNQSPFTLRILQIIAAVPYGQVVSYGQVAVYAGVPRGARQVGWILNGTEGKIDLPWWRVINNKGYLSIRGTKYNDKMLQRKLLEAEGITVSEEFIVNMKKFRYIASKKELKKFALDNTYIEFVLTKFF